MTTSSKPLAEGSKAPMFSAKDQNGKTVQLSDFAGKKLILYFYPKDDTPGCTIETCAFRDSRATFANKGAEIVGVSPDPVKSHDKFAKKYSLEFPILADEDKAICRAYGVLAKKNMYGRMVQGVQRTTFLIDENGVIQKIFRDVKPSEHIPEVWDEL